MYLHSHYKDKGPAYLNDGCAHFCYKMVHCGIRLMHCGICEMGLLWCYIISKLDNWLRQICSMALYINCICFWGTSSCWSHASTGIEAHFTDDFFHRNSNLTKIWFYSKFYVGYHISIKSYICQDRKLESEWDLYKISIEFELQCKKY